VRGVDGKGIITEPAYNKGMGFTHGERDRLGIRGLVVREAHPVNTNATSPAPRVWVREGKGS